MCTSKSEKEYSLCFLLLKVCGGENWKRNIIILRFSIILYPLMSSIVYKKKHDSARAKKFSFMRMNKASVTPRHVLRDKKRASAGPKGQFLSALNDEYFRQFNKN